MNVDALQQQWGEAVRDTVIRRAELCGVSAPTECSTAALEGLTLSALTQRRRHIRFLNLLGSAGAGKSRIGAELQTGTPRLTRLVRVTTRQPLPAEISDVDYHFYTREQFLAAEAAGALFGIVKKTSEWRAMVLDEFLGLVRSDQAFYIDGKRTNPAHFLEDQRVRDVPFATIFLLPPDFQTLFERLRGRTAAFEELGEQARDLAGDQNLEKWIAEGIEQLRASNELYNGSPVIDGYVVNTTIPETAAKLRALFT